MLDRIAGRVRTGGLGGAAQAGSSGGRFPELASPKVVGGLIRRGGNGFPGLPEGGGAPAAGHAFISYVREDSRRVDQLQEVLEGAGIRVWRDTGNLWPGEDWRAKIRQAITDDALVFIACFSRASLGRHRSYQNEELVLAIEQLRLRRPDDPWLIPVRLDACDIPDLDIGGGRTLGSIQRVDLFGDRSGEAAARLIAAVLRILEPMSGPGRARPGPTAAEGEGEPRAGRWRPGVPAGYGRAAVTVLLLAVALLIPGAYVLSRIAYRQDGSTVTGSVDCESGRPVVGVWISASAGQGDSGYAHLGPPGFSGISYPVGARGTYTYRLPHAGSYAVHVGCGGTARHWASSSYSPLLSGQTADLHCHDPASPAHGTSPRGRCTVTAP